MKPIVIGIAGRFPGSGKTTLAHKLKDALGDDIVLLATTFTTKPMMICRLRNGRSSISTIRMHSIPTC